MYWLMVIGLNQTGHGNQDKSHSKSRHNTAEVFFLSLTLERYTTYKILIGKNCF